MIWAEIIWVVGLLFVGWLLGLAWPRRQKRRTCGLYSHDWTNWTIVGKTENGWSVQRRNCKQCNFTEDKLV